MDTSGLSLPLLAKEASGEERYCDGKIFYMGIIDILQEYTARKSLETTYRSFLNSGKGGEVSCVPPISYAGRFVNFFEEFSKRTSPSNKDYEELSSTRAEL
jgi:1-phosphatidylinositol-4-phosphate 5-kinase